MAIIVTFPTARRIGLIRRNARLFAGYGPKGSKRALDALIKQQRAAMERQALLSPAEIDAEINVLRTAILTEIAKIVGSGRAFS